MKRTLCLVLGTVVTLMATTAAHVPVAAAATRPQRPHAPSLTHHLNMVYVTLARVQTEGQINDYTTPSAGNTFVTVWLRAVNRNDVQQGVSAQDFKLLTATGEVVDASFQTLSPSFGGLFMPGGSLSGSITFEVPKGAHHATLRWAPSPSYYEAHWPEMTWSVRY